jgi:hypothetical protein
MTNISRLHFAHLPMPIETLPRLSETLGGSRLLSNATTKPGSPLAAARLRSSYLGRVFHDHYQSYGLLMDSFEAEAEKVLKKAS